MKSKTKKAVKKEATKAKRTEEAKTALAVAGDGWLTFNARGRETVQDLTGIGLNSFNSYVGDKNVLGAELKRLAKMSDAIKLELVNAETETGFFIIKGNGGLHGNKVEKAVVTVDGEKLTLFRHRNGTFVSDKLLKGYEFVDGKGLLAIARERKDLRQFKTISQENGKETLHAGAVIGRMADKRQALVVNNGEGLDVVCLTTGKIGKAEKADLSVEIGALTEADRTTIQAQIFMGAAREKSKAHARNTVRRVRKAIAGK